MSQSDLWQAGRYRPARRLDSPNCEPRPAGEAVSLVVLHNISLPPFEYGTGAVEKLFTNRINPAEHPFFAQIAHLRVSSHFLIARSGAVSQFVSCDEMAYHAGASSFRGRENWKAAILSRLRPPNMMRCCRFCTRLSAAIPSPPLRGIRTLRPRAKPTPGIFLTGTGSPPQACR